MIRPKNETEDFLLPITKNCETLIEQTHTKPQEVLEFKIAKRRETFHFDPPIRNKGEYMLRLTSLEVYNSFFNITEENNKFELHKFPVSKSGGISYEKVRDEIEKDLEIADITAADLQDDVIGPIIIEENREQVKKRIKKEKNMDFLGFCIMSIFQDLENYLRTEIDFIEDDIRLVLDEYNSSFITYKLEPGIYNFKDLSEGPFQNLQPENEVFNSSIDIKLDDITMKTSLVVKPGTIAIRFDGKSFFSTVLVLLQVGIINTIMNTIAKKL